MSLLRSLASTRHVVVAAPILKMIVIVMGVLAGISLGGGIVAIIWNAFSPTQFDVLGVTLTTGHVGVAFAALGLVTMLFVIRAVLKYTHRLAALPNDEYEAFRESYDGKTKTVAQVAISDPVVEHITSIVKEAISDSGSKRFSRIPLDSSQKTIESGLILRKYFGAYLGRLILDVKKANHSNITDISKSIDAFLSETWMNHLLDSSVDTYVVKDYLVEINELIIAKGGTLKRLPQGRIQYLFRDWERLSHVTLNSLETVLSSLPKEAVTKRSSRPLGSERETASSEFARKKRNE